MKYHNVNTKRKKLSRFIEIYASKNKIKTENQEILGNNLNTEASLKKLVFLKMI